MPYAPDSDKITGVFKSAVAKPAKPKKVPSLVNKMKVPQKGKVLPNKLPKQLPMQKLPKRMPMPLPKRMPLKGKPMKKAALGAISQAELAMMKKKAK